MWGEEQARDQDKLDNETVPVYPSSMWKGRAFTGTWLESIVDDAEEWFEEQASSDEDYEPDVDVFTQRFEDRARADWARGHPLPPLPGVPGVGPFRHGFRFGIASVGTKVYVIGGYDDYYEEALSCVDVFDTAKGSWAEADAHPPMQRERGGGMCVAVVGTRIFVFGGAEYAADMSSVATGEVFDTVHNTWSDLPEKPNRGILRSAPRGGARAHMGTAVLDGKVYLLGGHVPLSHGYDVPRADVDVFDTETHTWSKAAPMHVPRYNQTFGSSFACAFGGKVYAFQHESGSRLSLGRNPARQGQARIEAYDPSTDAWTTVPDIDRDTHHVAVLGEYLCTLQRSNECTMLVGTTNCHFSMYDSDLVLLVRLELGKGSLPGGFTPCAVGATGMLLLVGGGDDYAEREMHAIQVMNVNGWRRSRHGLYLAPLQDAIRAVLESQQRLDQQTNPTHGPLLPPAELWFLIFAFLDDRHFFIAGGGPRARALRA